MISTRMISQRLCRKLGWRALLTVLSALPIALHAAPGKDESLVVAVTANARPMAWRNETGELVGLNVELARAICERVKRRCRIIDLPIEDVLAGVTRGDVDIAVANLASTPKRADLMLLSQAYLRGPSMWIGRGTTEQSHNLRVATPADIRWEFVQAHKAERHWTPVPVKSWSEVFDVLRQGKADAAMVNFVVAQNFLAESGLQAAGFGLVPVKSPELSAGAHIGVSKARGATLLRQVDAALETLNLNGKLDALMARHLPFCIS